MPAIRISSLLNDFWSYSNLAWVFACICRSLILLGGRCWTCWTRHGWLLWFSLSLLFRWLEFCFPLAFKLTCAGGRCCLTLAKLPERTLAWKRAKWASAGFLARFTLALLEGCILLEGFLTILCCCWRGPFISCLLVRWSFPLLASSLEFLSFNYKFPEKM